MFRDTLHLPVETPENPFVAPANTNTIETFMNRVGYQGLVDKVNAFYTKNLAQPWLIIADLMKKFPNIPKRLEEDYHSIKDDVPLVSMYTTENILVRGMLILDALLTAEIRETDDFKEYETVFMKVAILMNQPQPVVSTQGTNRTTPRAPRTPTVSASPQETKKRKQTAGESSSRRITIKRKKQSTPSITPPGDDQERDAIAEATLLSLTLHKTALLAEAQENIAKVQEKLLRYDEVIDEKEKEVVEIVKETNVDDTSAKKHSEVVMEKEVVDMLDKIISKELANTATPTTTTSSKTPSTTTRQKKSFIAKTRRLPESIAGMCRRRGLFRSHIKTKFITQEFFVEKIKEVIQDCDKLVPELTVTTTNDLLKKEMPRLVKLAVNKDREVSPIDIYLNTTLNLYPKIKSSTATTSSTDLQQQLYLIMKTKPQDQAADLELRMFESKFLKKPPLLSELDQDIMKAYEREISKRLSHRQQMRRWESFVNERPILQTMKHL
ncbi:hypothetical protein Tco_1032292 [Tanacetum coccineum]|uniref:Uncharacterized protein n=1 Tax=Tanacetum coccineum TaxID=301880 RepID=A0ABQ5GBJ3_9ASTR